MKNFKYSWQQVAKASFVGIATTATFYLAKTTGLFSSWLSTDEVSDVLVESKEVDTAINAGQRRLLQQGAVTVTNPIPDQVIQVEQQYTYPLNNVFSGNYSFLGAVETGKNKLPSWLSLQPQLLSTYVYPAGNNADAREIVINGSIAFVAAGKGGLQILNVTDPSNPQLISTYPAGIATANGACGVAISGNTVFVAAYTDGLGIIDVSNMSNPRLLSLYKPGGGGAAFGVAINGSTVFLANNNKLHILDVNNLSNPQPLSNFTTSALGVEIRGSAVLVAANSIGLQILDVSNVSNPRLLGAYSAMSGNANRAVAKGNTAFVADGSFGLQIIDISNMSNPLLIGAYSTGSGKANGITLRGNTAFVAYGSFGLQIIDVSNASNPLLVGAYPSGSGEAWGVAISASTIFVANWGFGLQILDVSYANLMGVPPLSKVSEQISITISARDMNLELANNRFMLTLDQLPRVVVSTLNDQSVYPNQSITIFVSSELLFVNPGNSFLKLGVKSSNKAPTPKWLNLSIRPVVLSTLFAGLGAYGVVVNGSTAFVGANGLQIVNVSEKNNPQILSNFSTGPSLSYTVALNNNTVFLLTTIASPGRLYTFDVSNTKNPRLLSTFNIPGVVNEYNSIAITGNTLFLACGNLRILDISNTSNPKVVSTFGSASHGIVINDGIAFVANEYQGLKILDIRNTSNLYQISNFSAGNGAAYGIAIKGSTVFVADLTAGLQIFNVINVSAPILLSSYPAGIGYALGVTIIGSTAFVADGSAGLLILDVSNTSDPQLLGYHSGGAGGIAYGIDVSGNIAFLADGEAGLLIFDLSQWELTAKPGFDDVGNYQLQLIATDELGGSASTQPFTIRVEGAPRFNATIPTQYAKVGQAFNYFIPQGLVSDPNFDPISFSANLANNQSLPAWLTFSGISAAFVGNPQASHVGNLTIVLSATDNIAGSANTSFILMTNNLPVVNQRLTNTFARVNQFFQLLIPNNTFSHPDGLALNYSAQLSSQAALPNWLRFNATSLFLSGQPNATDAGSYDLRIIATDRYAGQASTSFTLSVGNGVQVNRLMNSQLAGVGLRYVFAVPSDSFINPDGTPFSLQTGTLPSWLTFATTTAQFTGTPLSGSRGTSLINVTATDLTGGTAMQSFNLTVTYFPQVVSPIADQIAPIGFAYQLNVSNSTFIDQNGYPLMYRAEQTNGQALPAWLIFNATRLQFFGLPNITQALRYSLDVIATNPLGAEGRDTFALYAEHYPTVQQPIPDAVAGVDQRLRLTISGSSFSDLDNDVLRYNVTRPDQSLLPNWLSFDAQALILSGTPLSAQLGNLTLLMTATDLSGGSAQQNFTIIVRYLPTLSQPVGSIAPVREGRLLNYTLPPGTFTDGNGATLYYNATQDTGAALPTWLNFNVFTQHFLGIPASSDVGALAVRVIADDGQGGQASVSFSFTITPNYPPTLSKPVSNSVASVNQPFRLVLPPDTFTDANADPLNYTASQVDGSALPRWLAFDEKTITFSGTPGRSDTGDFSERIIPIRVTARDDQSRASTQFNINVQGTSNIALFLQIATPIATIFTGVFAAYQKRALCFNRYKKQRYQRLDVEVQAGELFEYKFGDMSMQGKKVLAKTPRQLQGVSRFFLSPRERVPGSGDMPSWMVYDLDTNSVRSVVPVPDDSPSELIIQVKDEAGVVHEQFTLRVTGLKTTQTEQPTTDVELAHTAAL